jgi:Flp pilus assembly protein TadD
MQRTDQETAARASRGAHAFIIGFGLVVAFSLRLHAQSSSRPSIREHMETAQRFLAAGKTQAAAREFQAILAMDPKNIDARVDLGVMAFFQHNCSLAVPNLRMAVSLEPSLSKPRALLGLCEQHQGNSDEAANDLSTSLPNLGHGKLATLVGSSLIEIYYQKGELNRAARFVAELQRASPTDPDVLFMAYRIHTELAERARDTLALVAPDSARMHELMAEQFVNRGDATDAIAQYEKALAKDPALPGVHYELGEAIMQQSISGDALGRAQHELKLALSENPNNAGADAKLGRIALLRRNLDQARRCYQRALLLDPNQIDALKGMADIDASQGDSGPALKYLLRASQAAPLDDSVHYQLAALYRKLGRKEEAGRELAEFQKLRAIKNQTSLAEQRSQDALQKTSAPRGHP